MLLAAIGLWAVNLSVTRTILTNGFQPLAYGTTRYGLAAITFVGLTLVAERTLRVERRDVGLVLLAAGTIFVNQVGFVYALESTSASVIALILGSTPLFAAVIGIAVGLERLSARFWLAATVSFAGVGLVAVGTGRAVGGDLRGVLLGILTAATWAAYSVTITPLMRRYSPSRISALVLGLGWVPIAIVGWPQTSSQDWALGWEIWALFLFATFGPLVVTNILWFRSLDRIGPARATLATNLQPFVAAVLAVVLLSESLSALQLVGGLLIAAGILLARRRGPPAPHAE
jgi:drug/metabolite transporter (DMT)-like permease